MDSQQTRFTALLEAHRGIVLKVAATYARGLHDRQDLAQEITVQLWRAFGRYEPTRLFSTWMYRIALNVAISYLRTTAQSERTSSLAEHPEDPAAMHVDDCTAQLAVDQRVHTLYAVIERQSPLDRALLMLWLEERSQREIAEIIGISESNVATKLNRLKQRIREQLATPNQAGQNPSHIPHGA